jgi:hypothetical protein
MNNFKIPLFIIILINIFISCNGQTCASVENRTDYKGSDFHYNLTLTTLAACCESCAQNSSCNAWTFVTDVKMCWLKTAITNRKTDNRCMNHN